LSLSVYVTIRIAPSTPSPVIEPAHSARPFPPLRRSTFLFQFPCRVQSPPLHFFVWVFSGPQTILPSRFSFVALSFRESPPCQIICLVLVIVGRSDFIPFLLLCSLSFQGSNDVSWAPDPPPSLLIPHFLNQFQCSSS